MKTTNEILETSVINLHDEILKSEAYEIAKMKFEDLQREIADNENWEYLKQLRYAVLDIAFKTLEMKQFINFIHKNDNEE